MAYAKRNIVFVTIFFIISILLLDSNSNASTSSSPSTNPGPSRSAGGVSGEVSGSGTVMPDLFTGTMSYSIPIEVPFGRKGMQPNLALTYRSNNGNGWIGMGWDLEVGAIERSAKDGINFTGEGFILRMAGTAIDLVKVNGEYYAKIENGFNRIKQKNASDGTYWEITDKSGMVYTYGTTTASRQDDPSNAGNIFKWCLDNVKDTNGNYMNVAYTKDQGQIYLRQIDYAGNSNSNTLPANSVKFYLESRTDAPDMYSTNFKVKTAYRLKAIEVLANNNKVRAYSLVYDADPNTSGSQYSASTGRSLLYSVQQYGDDYTLDSSGALSGGSSLPATKNVYSSGGGSFNNGVFKKTDAGATDIGVHARSL